MGNSCVGKWWRLPFDAATGLRKPLGMLLIFFSLMLPGRLHRQPPAVPIYLDARQPIEARVDDLMNCMTLKEKVDQLNLPCVYVDQVGKSIPEKLEAGKRFVAGTYTDEIGP